ncbi:unnamed protein product [Orchesella dallaii]|uniref:Major facilitator superfamily (MFS) profile domain-containing protein n=1 Tax=Orchesella dallaii TaxID=48710 RepID=A0ABP1PNK5_9HEXA
MGNAKYIINQTVATIAVTTGIFGLGTVLAWSSPALPDMVNEKNGYFYNISIEQQSWVGSVATLGALASAPVAGFTVERMGRKGTMVLFSFPFILGWLVVGFATNVIMMCIGRFITGFCGGVFSLSAPLYIGESVSSNIRGMLMNSFQLMLVTGILFTYVVGTYVPWKTLTLISAAIPVVFLFFVPFIPESPRYLRKKGQVEKADNALSWLFGPLSAEKPNSEPCDKDENESKVSYKDLLKPDVIKPLAVALTLMVLEQASAFNVVIFYCVDIFAQTGTGLDSYWSSIIVAIVQVLATVFGTFLVDRAGRRVLLIWSEFIMGISFVALGIFFYLKKINDDHIPSGIGWLPLVSVLVFIIAFSIGIGPLSWTIMGEILHPDVKGLCSGIATSFVWFSAFVVTKIYQTLVAAVGIHWSFWIFSSVSLLGTVIVYLYVPETKGKTLEEIQQVFAQSSKGKRLSIVMPVQGFPVNVSNTEDNSIQNRNCTVNGV